MSASTVLGLGLRCPADHLPSILKLQTLVPQSSHASRRPQLAEGGAPVRSAAHATGPASRRRERSTLWQDSMAFSGWFFAPERHFEAEPGEWRPLDNPAFARPAAIVQDEPIPLPQAARPLPAASH